LRFGSVIVVCKLLEHASFKSVDDLKNKILNFIDKPSGQGRGQEAEGKKEVLGLVFLPCPNGVLSAPGFIRNRKKDLLLALRVSEQSVFI
jgi:hypothetical protein